MTKLSYISLLCCLPIALFAEDNNGRIENNSAVETNTYAIEQTDRLPENSERLLPNEHFTFWGRYEDLDTLSGEGDDSDEPIQQNINLSHMPVQYNNGKSVFNATGITELGEILQRYQNKSNLRVNFVGYTCTTPIRKYSTASRYGDNVGLSRARAERAAKHFQEALNLDDSMISWEGRGATNFIAPNDTEANKQKNRRVEIEVWYDEDPVVQPKLPQTRVCRSQPMCKVVTTKRDVTTVSLENVIEPLRLTSPIEYDSAKSQIPQETFDKLIGVLESIRHHRNIQLIFNGHTDNVRINPYGEIAELKTNQRLSEKRARIVSEVFKDKLNLDDSQIRIQGFADRQPLASNKTARGRALNRRVELHLWYDRNQDTQEEYLTREETIQSCELPSSVASYTKTGAIEVVTTVEEVGGKMDPRDAFELPPFRITVDGSPTKTENIHNADEQRCTDVELEHAKLQVQFDNLQLQPRLALNAWPSTVTYQDNADSPARENQTTFTAYTNYQAYIDKAEVRIFNESQSLLEAPMEVVPLNDRFQATWAFDEAKYQSQGKQKHLPKRLKYVLRVYDGTGRFDETKPQPIWLSVKRVKDIDPNDPREMLVSYGENALASQNIRFDSGTITVNGIDIPNGHQVYVMGQTVPVDPNGRFVMQQIIPEGLHTIEVAVLDELGNGKVYHRDLELKESDWFYVGIADITAGIRDTDGPASTVTQNDRYDDDSYIDGRFAFYTKGKTESNWEITASADTREEPLEDIFKNFTNKDPNILFRRLDPDYYYPTYGDDSTLVEDAPTQGKFYFKAQKDQNFGLWGNFESKILDTELAQIDRALYGAQLHLESDGSTRYGEDKIELDLFAAEPGTRGAREEFRGTGGSLYFLRHQDITIGSERIRIEVRDKDTDLVIEQRNLIAGQDYDIDPIQGRVLLNTPLSASSSDGSIVRDDSIAGNENFLVVTYEFTPGFEDLDELALGGRYSQWVNDHVQIGVTGTDQEGVLNDERLTAFDLTLRSTPSHYVKLEAAQSEGLSSDQLASSDGGFAFSDLQDRTNLDNDQKANAYRIETGLKLGDDTRVTGFLQQREAGFSAPGQLTTTETDQLGITVSHALTDDVRLSGEYNRRDEEVGQNNESIEVDADIDLTESWSLGVGVRNEEQENTAVAQVDQGERTDVAAELTYDSRERWKAHVFAQGTLDSDDTRDDNHRGGIGGEYQIADRLTVEGEVSGGNRGTGVQLGTNYQATDRTQLYSAYALENTRSDTGLRGQRGNANAGFKTRYTDNVSIYGEERLAHGDQPVGLTHAYGVDLAPTDHWNVGFNLETGNLEGQTGDEIERLAIGSSLGYGKDDIKYSGSLEFRTDETSTNERETWLLRQKLSFQNSEDWRTTAKLNWSQSDSSQGEFFDGDFTEFVLGYAYRPVDKQRLNALLKYTYFFNKPAPEQVSTTNVNSEFVQRSHIFAVDMNYDLTKRWSIGGKYAYRLGELSLDRVDPDFFKSRAHLFVVRADWHVVKSWDFLVEARHLETVDAQDSRGGFLTGIYKHFGNHLKAGVGYNFTDFSDDLTDLSFDSEGVFINIIGKI